MGRSRSQPLPMWKAILGRAIITLAAAGILFVLRPDLATSLRGAYQQWIHSPLMIRSYLNNHTVRMLNIGAGPDLKPGWLNTDIDMLRDNASQLAYLDASKPFPLPDQSFQFVYSEQVIEHLTMEEAVVMLTETRRILAPNGRVRIATPDLRVYVSLFDPAKKDANREFIRRKLADNKWPATPDPECLILNLSLHEWGHKFVYTPKMLQFLLETTGFTDVRQVGVGESETPALKGIESRGHGAGAEMNAEETMVFEARRP